MSTPPDNSQSDKMLERGFAVILGIFSLAVVLMLAFVVYSCLAPGLGKKSMQEDRTVQPSSQASRIARYQRTFMVSILQGSVR
jgi:hypothetical protein